MNRLKRNIIKAKQFTYISEKRPTKKANWQTRNRPEKRIVNANKRNLRIWKETYKRGARLDLRIDSRGNLWIPKNSPSYMKRDLTKRSTVRPMERPKRHIINASKRDLHVLKETYQNRPNDRPVWKAYHQWRKKSPTYMKRDLQKKPTQWPMDRFERHIIIVSKRDLHVSKETYPNRPICRPMHRLKRHIYDEFK